jgi:hypothetical protein
MIRINTLIEIDVFHEERSLSTLKDERLEGQIIIGPCQQENQRTLNYQTILRLSMSEGKKESTSFGNLVHPQVLLGFVLLGLNFLSNVL